MVPVYVEVSGSWVLIRGISTGEARSYGMIGEEASPRRPRHCVKVPVDSTKVSKLIAELVKVGIEAEVFLDPRRDGVDYYASVCSDERRAARRHAEKVRRIAGKIGALLEE